MPMIRIIAIGLLLGASPVAAAADKPLPGPVMIGTMPVGGSVEAPKKKKHPRAQLLRRLNKPVPGRLE